jgi:hypothetical protein
MITVILKGGLGNILFQYAVGRHLAIKTNTTLRLNVIHYMKKLDPFAIKIIRPLQDFGFTEILYRPPIYKKILCRYGLYLPAADKKFYHEKGWGFDPKVLEINDGVYLDGFFQSEKYFKDIEPTIRKDLLLKEPSFSQEALIYKEKIVNSNSVGIHIRRGDYLHSQLHNICDLNYYAKAIEYIKERLTDPSFFVFSDDIAWCLKNIKLDNNYFIRLPDSKRHFISDFWLLSLCKHTIIPNSTFSWWAAWLNANPDKIVVVPHRWFADETLNAKALQDTIPEKWGRLAW